MLARSFLTPAELKIEDGDFEALLKVLGMLERGELPWHASTSSKEGFNMDRWPSAGHSARIDEHRGSVGCIGYWAEKLGARKELSSRAIYTELYGLFFPKVDNKNYMPYKDIQPEHAAQALQNYLNTGKADWDAVLAHKR